MEVLSSILYKNSSAKDSLLRFGVEFSYPEIQYDGQYSEKVIGRGLEVFRNTLKKYSAERFHDFIFAKSIFSMAFEELLTMMDVEYGIIVPEIVNRLALDYSQKASEYIASNLDLDFEIILYDQRALLVKQIITFIIECQVYNFKIDDSIKLTFLEFIYRFAGLECKGDRFGMAVMSVYVAIDPEKFPDYYNLIVNNFSPNRLALPVFHFNLTSDDLIPLKNIFVIFLTRLYEKIIKIDHRSQSDIFNRHACALIASMTSCSFYEEFMLTLEYLFERVNVSELLKFSRFAVSATEIIKKTKSQNSIFTDLLARILLDENLINSFDPENYINYGSIIFQIYSDHRSVYDKYFGLLSIETTKILLQLENKVSKYFHAKSKLFIFNNLEYIFEVIDKNQFSDFSKAIDSLIKIFPEFSKNNHQSFGISLSKIVRLIPVLVKISLKNLNHELNSTRLLFLIKMTNLTISTSTILQKTTESFSSVLLFINFLNQNKLMGFSISSEIHTLIANIVQKLIENDRFFKDLSHKTIIYNYHKNISSENADQMMSLIFFYYLERSSNKKYTFADVIKSASKLKIDINSYMLSFVIQNIKKLFNTNIEASDDIANYNNGIILYFTRLLVQENLLSKTQRLFLENFF